jgi:hypothetical protein
MRLKKEHSLKGVRLQFLEKTAIICQRRETDKKPAYFLIFHREINPKKRYISSLYETDNPDILALEYKGKYYALNLENLVIEDDSEGKFWRKRS